MAPRPTLRPSRRDRGLCVICHTPTGQPTVQVRTAPGITIRAHPKCITHTKRKEEQ